MIYKTPHKKLMIQQQNKNEVNWDSPERSHPAPLVTPSCNSCSESSNNWCMRRGGRYCDFDKRNILVAICDTDIP